MRLVLAVKMSPSLKNYDIIFEVEIFFSREFYENPTKRPFRSGPAGSRIRSEVHSGPKEKKVMLRAIIGIIY